VSVYLATAVSELVDQGHTAYTLLFYTIPLSKTPLAIYLNNK